MLAAELATPSFLQTLDVAIPAETIPLLRALIHEMDGIEIVMGTVTQASLADVVFRPLLPTEFASSNNPGYVKIVWTLPAAPIGTAASVFHTETRAATTDPTARAKFRWTWSKVSPGVGLIRRMSPGPLRTEAERRAREVKAEQLAEKAQGKYVDPEM